MLPPHNLCALVNPIIILPYPCCDETLLVFRSCSVVIWLLKVFALISRSNSFFMVLFICSISNFCFDMFCVNKLIMELNNENIFIYLFFLSFVFETGKVEKEKNNYRTTHGISQLNCTFPLYFIWVIKV